MSEKEPESRGTGYEPLFTGIWSEELIALAADTLLFLVIGALVMMAVLSLYLGLGRNYSFLAIVGGIAIAGLLFGLYLAVRRSLKTIKREHQ